MKKVVIRDIFTFMCTLATVISSIIIICTFLTQYQFIYVTYIFSNYLALQIAIFITMTLWSLRFFFYRKGRERLVYSGVCILIAIISMFFMMNKIR